ncbi:MAG: aminotransferase class I/II-fold pyridoxal phosphate-dependent enzyme [Alphaproteobacteria bacterium]|nr:aminotransferase class I/II-fold pyridoxal phosphate-dependent enzyme [Alphaproteobacteria bacterium]
MLASIRRDVAEEPESGIIELVNHARDRPDLIRLWVGEGDLPTPSFIGEAAIAALRDGQTFYSHSRGIPPLRRAIAAYVARLHGVAMSPERISVTVGGMQAVMETLQMLTGPGDELVYTTPAWPNAAAALRIAGGVPRAVPLGFGNRGWDLDLDRLFDACGPRTKAIVINSPNNPTGWVMARDAMIALRDFARARGLWIISDEVYQRLTYDLPQAPSFLEIMEPEERLIVTNTFSKNWSMTGWRIGWLVAPAALGQVYENLNQFSTSGVATFLQFGAIAAIEGGEPTVKALIDRCRVSRGIVAAALAGLPRVRFVPAAGAFYQFFAVDGEADSRALAFRLVEAGVGLAPGTAFGPGGEGYMRLCFAASPAAMTTAMERLVKGLG